MKNLSKEDQMCSVYGVETVVPENKVCTSKLLEALEPKVNPHILERIKNLGVSSRYSIVRDYENVLAGNTSRFLTSSATDLALKSIKKCMTQSSVDYSEITMLISMSNTVNQRLPCFGYEIMDRDREFSRATNIVNMENQGCSALVKAIDLASAWIQQGRGKVMIVSSDTPTGFFDSCVNEQLFDYSELGALSMMKRPTATQSLNTLIAASLFGDGAATMILGEYDESRPRIGFQHHLTNTDSDDVKLLSMDEGGLVKPSYTGMPKYKMSKFVKSRGASYARDVLIPSQKSLKQYLGSDEISEEFLLCHTGSRKILDGIKAIKSHKNSQMDLSYEILEKYGNLSGSSLPFMIANSQSQYSSMVGIILGFGVGFSASSAVLDNRLIAA